MKHAVYLFAVFLAGIGLAPPLAAQTAPAKGTGEAVAAMVDGEAIHGSDVKLFYDSLPSQYREIPLATLYGQLLDQVIDRKLVAAEARKTGFLDDPVVKRRFDFLAEGLLQQLYIESRLKDALNRDKLREEFERRIRSQPKQVEVRARHILLETEALAQAVIAELQGGADFAKLAKSRSKGPSGRDGGDLGFFGRGQMMPAFSEAAFALKDGEFTTEPVKTQFGWHVIKVEARRIAGGESFDEAFPKLRQEKSQQVISGIVGALRSKADIRILGTGKFQRVP